MEIQFAHISCRMLSDALTLSLLFAGLCLPLSAEVPIILRPEAAPIEQLVARELADGLKRIYPHEQFPVQERLPEAGRCIIVGNAAADTSVRDRAASRLAGPESFAVFTATDGRRELAIIAGADRRGVAYAVYALLERLGHGYFLSVNTQASPRTEPFSFEGWQFADKPLVRDRIVLEWHNFLSGCSTWNLRDWNQWTDQAQKMGYNAIMVHAYGNNPMVEFEFNGKAKPISCLTTTIKGNDWGVEHVNDVRRLVGGEVFDRAEFGADAALGPDEGRVEAAQRLMGEVLANAGRHEMEVYFANDVDTVSSNPQELILTLPREARFGTHAPGRAIEQFWLADPDTPEGYRYYKAQIEALFKAYPQITCLVVWFRQLETPWMELKLSEMPVAWQKEYSAEIARTPGAEKLWRAPQIFAIGKIVRAFDRALKELNLRQVQLAAGTWEFNFLAPCDRFFPSGVKLIGLDYGILKGRSQLGDGELSKVIRNVAVHREVIPVVWAQHDDGSYIGRSYAPFDEFCSRLENVSAAGFAICHWTTRPLDLYFSSCAKQVWQRTKNQALRDTCDDMAAKWFGARARGVMGEYLKRWVSEAPIFGRETSNWFIDPPTPLTNVGQVVAGCRNRVKLINAVDISQLTPGQSDRLHYFKGLEEFIAAFFQTQQEFQEAQDLLAKGDLSGARSLMTHCRPEAVIEQFAQFSSLGGITRGEQGLVVGLNTRWLAHIIGLRQALASEAVRVSFGSTQHDRLAQAHFPGIFTFFVDQAGQFWERWGHAETGADVLLSPGDAAVVPPEPNPSVLPARCAEEICRTGVESDKPIEFTLHPITAPDTKDKHPPPLLPAGDYSLRLLFLDPTSTVAGQRVIQITVAGRPADLVDLYERAGGARRIVELSYPVTLAAPGAVKVTLTPVRGHALICGAVLKPILALAQKLSATPDVTGIDGQPPAVSGDLVSFPESGIIPAMRQMNRRSTGSVPRSLQSSESSFAAQGEQLR